MSASIMQEDLTVSYLSGKGGVLEKHHVMNGNPFRKYAETHGLWIMLTPEEHRWIHDTSEGRKKARQLKAEAQRALEAKSGRWFWLMYYKKNYLEE